MHQVAVVLCLLLSSESPLFPCGADFGARMPSVLVETTTFAVITCVFAHFLKKYIHGRPEIYHEVGVISQRLCALVAILASNTLE